MARFVPRERKHRKLARDQQNGTSTNAELLVPPTPDEKEARRATLQAELRAAQLGTSSNASGKKRKRLDKYIEGKLRKEENAELIRKLARQDEVDTSLLQSSKKLGRVSESKRETLQRALRKRDAGVDVGGAESLLLEPRAQVELESEEDDKSAADNTVPTQSKPTASFGAGLKQPLDVDQVGRPLIRKRKHRKRVKENIPPVEEAQSLDLSAEEEDGVASQSSESSDEWAGFSDSGEELNSASASDSEDEDTESGADSVSTSSESDAESRRPRISAFKQWADAQRNAAAEFTPSTVPTVSADTKANFKPRAASPDPMLEAAVTQSTSKTARPNAAITIPRSEDVQSARLELPVVQEEQKIMETIHNNPVVVVCGATGSGKTTQVPQMLFENGYGSHIGSTTKVSKSRSLQSKGMIGITQPRRVAATSVADRVAYELGREYKNRVAHQVRYDSNVGRSTAIKFMTDGILLREIQQDFALTKYSCIVIDEAHERSVNTDILIGLLSRIVGLRTETTAEDPQKYYPLKLVIMSATLRVADFLENKRLFRNGPPPIVEAEGRQFPVTMHFARRTRRDFIDETVEKVAKGHRKLPQGGMLVFLTGQQEIQTVMARLKERLGGGSLRRNGDDYEDDQPRRRDDEYFEEDLNGGAAEDDADVEIETEDVEFAIEEDPAAPSPQAKGPLKPHILPLYAALPSTQQAKVFQAAPDGHRQIILATNVAETSLTIPGIKYVFDCGRGKEKQYGTATGVQTFENAWISKASASQRTGRAGRTGPGHCWRLYSSAVYEQFFAEHTDPEILRTPLESVVLQLKGFDIERVINFPFPTPPDKEQLSQAEKLLVNMGAIETECKGGTITTIGTELAKFPVSPRYGKMLLRARQNGVLEHVTAIVAALAVGELLIPEVQFANPTVTDQDLGSDDDKQTYQQREAKDANKQRHQAYTRAHARLACQDDRSDAVKLLTAIVMHADSAAKTRDGGKGFSADYFLREKGMEEAQKLRQQLWSILKQSTPLTAPLGEFKPTLSPPTDAHLHFIRQATTAGFIDQVAIRADALPTTISFGRKPRRATEVAYRTLLPTADAEIDLSLEQSEQELQRSVFVHPSSVLAKLSVQEMPQYIVYSHLSRVSPSSSNSKVPRTRMHPLTSVGPRNLAFLAQGTPLLEYGKPVGRPEEDVANKMRTCWVSVSLRAPSGEDSRAGTGAWPLDTWKVVQKRGKRGDWDAEKVVSYGVTK